MKNNKTASSAPEKQAQNPKSASGGKCCSKSTGKGAKACSKSKE